MNTREITDDQLIGPPSGFPGLLMSEQLTQSLRALRRRWRIIVFIPLLALVVSLVVSLRSATEYSATAKVVISPYNPVLAILSPGSNPTSADPERDLNTEVSEITETPVADMVRRHLKLTESSQALLSQVSANLEGTTNIVDIAVTDSDPNRAAAIANAFAYQYQTFRLASLRNTLQQSVASDEQKLAALTPAQRSAAAGTQLQNYVNTLQADSDGLTSDAQVSQVAAAPTSPSKPKPLTDGLIAVVVGLLVAIVAVVVLELLDGTVRDEEDAAAVAQLPTLGMIPKHHSSLQARVAGANVIDWHLRGGLRPPAGLGLISRSQRHEPGSDRPLHASGSAANGSGANGSGSRSGTLHTADWEVDESYGSLAVSLLARWLGPEDNVVMITSPGPQDGKTSVSLGLAAALAELGQRVVVVEGDLRRPRFADYLGLPPGGAGLSSLLVGVASPPEALIEVVAATHRPLPARTGTRAPASRGAPGALPRAGRSFTVLPCGPIPTRPLPLLLGPELGPLMQQLQSSADIVLVDTPPLGAIKDAVILADCVDQIVLVARVRHTRRDALGRCRAAVAQLGSPVLGIVTVGGSRGGAMDYYFRPELDASRTRRNEPRLAVVRQRRPQPQPEPEPQLGEAPKPEPAAAAAGKGSRSRRRTGADNSG